MKPLPSQNKQDKSKLMTLEQRRAQHAWKCVEAGVDKEYVNVAKALPQLVMNSGLMQALAYLQQKGGAHERVAKALRIWLCLRFNAVESDPGFPALMKALLEADAEGFRLYTAEAFAWLKWLRQLAAAQEIAK
jgi:CRISPR-associated protein Cmr5